MDVGCLVDIPEMDGLTRTAQTMMVAIFMRRESGVRTWRLNDSCW